jgi:hypothetical protein
MIPPDRLPYVSGRGPVEEAELAKVFAEGSNPVPFTLNRNLRVYVSSVLCKFDLVVTLTYQFCYSNNRKLFVANFVQLFDLLVSMFLCYKQSYYIKHM